jgi:integrase
MTDVPALTIERNDLSLPAADIEAAAAFARNEKAPATRAAYRADFGLFSTWCTVKGVDALPASPETVAAFLAHEADQGSAASTITRRCAAIRYAHRLEGLRDRALLLLGFAGAFRRSELVALNVADLEETEDGFKITIRRSKTDQEGHGQAIAILRGGAACPVKAVKKWMEAAGISEGPLFRPVAKGGRPGAQRLTNESASKVPRRCRRSPLRCSRCQGPGACVPCGHLGRCGPASHSSTRAPARTTLGRSVARQIGQHGENHCSARA